LGVRGVSGEDGFEDVVPANIDEVVGFVKMDGGHGLLLFKVYMMGRVEEKGR
jgi:hypothetical protein